MVMKFGSLFSGIGGFDLGFQRAGLECEWQIEKDKDCNRVLSRHWPNVQRFDDVTTVREFSPVDVICGGFPCQDLSVAGKRAGLAGERSGLWFEFLRIIESNLPRFIVIENVPGLLSSDEGRDFAAILRGLVECGYCLAWRVVDAQYFGVAQRRRRVFIVGSLGNGSCAEILFESESVSRNPPTRREARQGTPFQSERRAYSDSGPGYWREGIGTLRAEGENRPSRPSNVIAGAVSSKWAKGTGGPAGDEAYNLVTHALRSEGADASEDGTGRGTPLVVADCLTRNYGKQPDSSNRNAGPVNLIAFSSKDHGADAGEISPTLRSMNFDESHINGGGQVAIAFAQNSRDEVRVQGDGNISGSLSSEPGMKQTTYIATLGHSQSNGLGVAESTTANTLEAVGSSNQAVSAGGNFGVRRLTPRECERLQGFPDDWTAIDHEGKAISDSARYRMLGNAVETHCAEWIGKRLFSTQATASL